MSYSHVDHTFVVCAYGESEYLPESLNSLKNQSVRSNVIISTSTPNDYIRRVAQEFEYKIYVNTGKTGIAEDWNFALSCAQSSLATLAHQDDVYACNYLEMALSGINASDKPLLYFTNYGEVRDKDFVRSSSLTNVKKMLLWPMQYKSLRANKKIKRLVLSFGNPICCPSVTYVKAAIPIPLFENRFRSNLDWEAWEKCSLLNGEFIYDQRVGMYHRVHEGSETSACIVDNVRVKEDLEMLERFWPKPIAQIINKLYKKAQQYN